MLNAFCRYDLRTTDPDAARTFYVDAVAIDFAEAGPMLAVWPLHEQARARGVPNHWLGHVAVADLATAAQELLDRGSQLLGPPLLRGEDGEAYAVLRDPCEAVVAVRETSRAATGHPVLWHQLHTRDRDRSWALYSELFGWFQTGTIDVNEPAGEHRLFRWNAAEMDVGSMANTARLPGIHPHWLFYFPTPDLENTLAKVSARGGRALAPAVLGGHRIAACEDPQGAAFGLVQLATEPDE
jgi:predicted enzyme related to lactoylglutathione lyase